MKGCDSEGHEMTIVAESTHFFVDSIMVYDVLRGKHDG